MSALEEHHRDARSFPWLDDARRDAATGLRMLARARGFTWAAVSTLALGIGAATVIFSLLHSILLSPFPYTAPRRMVDVVVRDASNNILRGPLLPDEFEAYLQAGDVFEDVAGTITQSMLYVGDTDAQRLSVGWGTPNMFTFLGVSPMQGRVWGPADAAPGAPPVAVLNHRAWQTTFGGDPAIVGRTITLNDTPRTVIGIMPPRFEWHVADFWVPAGLDAGLPDEAPNKRRWLQARLRPGVTVEEAEARLKVIATNRAAARPQDYPPGSRVQVITIIDWVAGRFRYVLYTLFGAVTLLLLIACCNVANMLLARATVREHEITVRAALGASRSRIIRQLLAESVVLAAGGLAAGALAAYGGIALLSLALPRQGVAWEVALSMNSSVFLFSLAAAAAATLVFGLVPSLQVARRELLPGGSGTRSRTATRGQHRLRNGLVVVEVAISVVLLLGAGLLARSFVQLAQDDLGIGTDPDHLYFATLAFPPDVSESPIQHAQLQDVLTRVRRLPGIETAALSNTLIGGTSSPLRVMGAAPSAEPPRALVQFCTEDFRRTFGLPLLLGRDLSAAEATAPLKVALVNETFVRQQLQGQNAIGRTIHLERLTTPPYLVPDPTFEIVGVVGDLSNMGPGEPPMPQVFLPYRLAGPVQAARLLLRAADAPPNLAIAMRAETRAVNRRLALTPPVTLATALSEQVAQPRFSLMVLAIFALTGLGLVALGIYGVISYVVSQQTREIAIRMALGGERRHVRWQILRLTLRLVVAGLAVGLAGGFAVARLITSQLWDVEPHDPITFAAATAVVLVIGALACAVPVRRATRVAPAAALRHE